MEEFTLSSALVDVHWALRARLGLPHLFAATSPPLPATSDPPTSDPPASDLPASLMQLSDPLAIDPRGSQVSEPPVSRRRNGSEVARPAVWEVPSPHVLIIGVATAFTLHMMKPSVGSELAEANRPAAFPPQWLPMLLASAQKETAK